jgi:hypothetical protein
MGGGITSQTIAPGCSEGLMGRKGPAITREARCVSDTNDGSGIVSPWPGVRESNQRRNESGRIKNSTENFVGVTVWFDRLRRLSRRAQS